MINRMRNSFLFLAMVSALLPAAHGQQVGAEQLYRSSQGQGIKVSIELKRGGIVRRVSPQTALRTGDRIKIHFSTNFDGYVYAINQTPSGNPVLLFPTPETGSANFVQSGRDYVIPATNGWFRLDDETGDEIIHMVASRQPQPEMEQEHQLRAQQSQTQMPTSQAASSHPAITSQSYATPGTTPMQPVPSPASQGQTATSAVQQDVATAKNEMGKAQSDVAKATGSVGQVTNQAQKAKNTAGGIQKEVGQVQSGISITKTVTSMPKQLLGIFGARSRDLVFEDDPGEGAAYVSSPVRLSDQPVYFTVELIHQ